MSALALALALALDVRGGSACPSPADVRERLRPLLPSDTASTTDHHVRIERAADGVTIELLDAEDAPVATRRLASGASCADLAAAAAVVIATWEVELRGRGTLGLWLAPQAVAAPAMAPPPARAWWLGAGALADDVAGDAAGAATVELAVAGVHLDGVASVLAVGNHAVALVPGTATWRRLALGVGPRLHAGDAVQVEVGVQALVSGLWLQGREFARDRDDFTVDPGASLTARVAVRMGASFAPWVGVTLVGWPVGRELAVRGGPMSREFPRWEALAGVGARLRVAR